MMRRRFPLTSDQLELLIAFESADGLANLSDLMAKDPSVISRNLQRLAESLPVIEKNNGRWRMTPLGFSVNKITKDFLVEVDKTVSGKRILKNQESCFSSTAVLLIINAQNALLSPSLGHRSNRNAEDNIHKTLLNFRRTKRNVIHVQHVSQNTQSPFWIGSEGVQFISALRPLPGERIVEKTKSSSFTDTNLQALLSELNAETLILTGFTANDCIDATARHASDLGFTTYVIGDGTAMFDFFGPNGQLFQADKIHSLTLANLNALYAKVINTAFLLSE